MSPTQTRQEFPSPTNMPLDQWYEMSLSMIHGVCTIFTLPVEYVLRPFFGTRYFNPIITAFSFFMMMCLPLMSSFAGSITGLLSFGMVHQETHGFIGVGTFTSFFMFANAIHGFRLWRRMLHPEREFYGEYEGPPLPFFFLLPRGRRYWMVRIVYEPVFVYLLASTLSHLRIIDHFATAYLGFAAFCLFIKCWIEWYKSWLTLRITMDARARATLLARVIDGTANDDEMAVIHMARPPKSTPSDVLSKIRAQMASTLPPEIQKLLSPIDVSASTAEPATGPPEENSSGEAHVTPSGAPDSQSNRLMRLDKRRATMLAGGVFATVFILGRLFSSTPSAPPSPPAGKPIKDVSGVWSTTGRIQNLVTTYRFDLKQTGNNITGTSRKQVSGPGRASFAEYNVTGTNAGGKRLTLHETGLKDKSPDADWCVTRLLTLSPTAGGELTGPWDASPCPPGHILLKRSTNTDQPKNNVSGERR